MSIVKVEIKEMSRAEGRAWARALLDKFGDEMVLECVKEREHRIRASSQQACAVNYADLPGYPTPPEDTQ